ncbi:hypothetical protein NMY22_g12207 [Coprinellus aureogranulatus]|nr:hypothetical protein NMY22_g12207 [Coprinellus aureogranulatus]
MDIIGLLESNSRPSEDQESYFLERLSSLDSSISALSVKLAQAQGALDELDSQQAKLLRKRRSIASVVSSYRRLPVDVWLEIMKFAVWSSGSVPSGDSMQDTHGNPRPMKSKVHPPIEDPERTCWPESRQLSTLTRVCKDWRRILHEAAILWSTLELHIYSNDHNIDGFAPKLETWLSRSGELPWSLKVLSSKRQLHAPAFASFLLRNCARWKELYIYMHDLDILAPLFYLEPSSSGFGIPGGWTPRGRHEDVTWTNLQVLSLDGWFTDSARVRPFALVDNIHADDADPLSLHHATISLRGSVPALKSLTIDTPCQKVHSWKWIPWAQLSDVDLRTGDQYEDNISMLARCTNALETCSIVFTPSLRIPVNVPLMGQDPVQPITQGIANLLVTGLDGAVGDDSESDNGSTHGNSDAMSELLHLGGLKELTLKKIGYLSPLLSRLCAPALQKLTISMCAINEPEPFLGATLVDLLERSGAAISSSEEDDFGSRARRTNTPLAAGPPLTYLMLALENTRRRHLSTPAITNADYISIFERTEKLKTLHIKDYSTDARFLEKLNQREMLPRLRTISFVVDAERQGPERFAEFVKLRMDRLERSKNASGSEIHVQ